MKKAIKHIGIIMMFAATMMTISCGDKDCNANKIVGKWKCTSNKVTNPSSSWGLEIDNSLVGNTITFRRDGSFAATVDKLVDDAALGYWAISDKHLFFNGETYWKVLSFSETSLRIETYYVDGVGPTYDTAGVYYYGPYTREFKKE